jgi:ADP-dependent NAD(P)H-hydrate dehydratase / NAD(P)H-hydrate epimerase
MIELLTPQQMAQADRFAIASGIAGMALMERAGAAVAEAVTAARPAGSRVVVVAGPGNNGGDGFVAARILSERGYGVRVLLLGASESLRGDAAEAARRWQGGTEPADPAAIGDGEVVVDALFGAGLARAIEGLPAELIAAINTSGAPVVAVDLPSGISGATGAVMGVAVEATETVTFFRRKPGHLLLPGRLHCGSIKVADIGIPAAALDAIRPETFANAPSLWGGRFPVPRPDAHKYARGHAVAVSGGIATTGAARLAARAALRAGAGLVTIASPREALAVNAAAALAVMVRPVDGAEELGALVADRRLNAVMLGPGGGVGAAMREQARAALAGERAVVLDADALTSFEDDPGALFAAAKGRPDGSTVLTPHDGEFARLFKNFKDVIDVPSKLEKVIAAASLAGAVVLLKGPDTVVASPDGRAAIADNAPPWLATAGSGDVLAGLIGGLLAQRMPGFEAACAGVWLHGEAGREAGPGLISEDLPEVLPTIYRRLFADLGAKT